MARLQKVTQRVECGLPGYESVYIDVWVNAPQKIFLEWDRMQRDAIARGEDGKVEFERGENGEPVLDDDFQPIVKRDVEKQLSAGQYFLQHMVVNFSVDEDEDGNKLSISDPDFIDRVPTDLITWLYDAVTQVVNERKNASKGSVKLLAITGR